MNIKSRSASVAEWLLCMYITVVQVRHVISISLPLFPVSFFANNFPIKAKSAKTKIFKKKKKNIKSQPMRKNEICDQNVTEVKNWHALYN